jgi:hypothetical protein
MAIAHKAELLSAAGYLSGAADNLRAVGFLALADEIDKYIAMLDVEILLSSVADDLH